MNYLIFSDSHGRMTAMQQLLDRLPPAGRERPDAILFLGDGGRDAAALDTHGIPLLAVRGNCDLFTAVGEPTPDEHTLPDGEHAILMLHGHRVSVKAGLTTAACYAIARGADILLFGHTHERHEAYLPAGTELGGVILPRPLFLFNPGSVATGSFGRLHIGRNGVLFSHGRL